MSDPPNNPTPPQYAAYPRGQAFYGSIDKLQALADGYFGLNKVFILNIVMVFAVRIISTTLKDPGSGVAVFIGAVLLVGGVLGFATYPYNKKIGYGANWSPSSPLLAPF